MAPFEEFGDRACGARCRLMTALRASQASRDWVEGEPAIVTAYRNTGASAQHYPNSAELLRTIWCERLAGGIAEVCPDKHRALMSAWPPSSSMRVSANSWRGEVGQEGVLSCPEGLQVPWLFSMDPKTYKSGNSKDDDNLYESDVDLVSGALASFVRRGQPGIATLFVYNVGEEQNAFWKFAKRLAAEHDLGLLRHSIPHLGGKRNLVALLYSAVLELPRGFIEDAVDEIEDMVLAAAMQGSKREYVTREAVMDVVDQAVHTQCRVC